MKRLITILSIILCTSQSFAAAVDSTLVVKSSIIPTLPSNIDSLKKLLTSPIDNDTVKTAIYAQLATQYMKYDSVKTKRIKYIYQTNALNYIYLALHGYSRVSDTAGLRTCFDNLSKVYRSQKNYPQAKWFILQSNSLSRAKNDVPNILTSLIELASIKMDIKDYTLAMRDLNEALKLSTDNHLPHVEAEVQEKYALLYSHLKDHKREALALKRSNFIDDSISKAEKAALTAKIATQDSVLTKKKFSTSPTKKASKTTYSKRIASL